MAEPSSFRVNGIWAGGDVAGSITLVDNAGTLGWADAYFSRLASGQIGLNQDSTHGVVINVATDGIAQLLTRAGADAATYVAAAFRAPANGTFFWSARSLITSPADGTAQFTNNATSAGVRLNFATDGTAHFQTTAGADTATVRAANLRFGTHSAIGAETVSGFITITDAAGNARKLAVVS